MVWPTPSSRVLLFVFLFIFLASCMVRARRIDCTRFVFAPKCRGVAAKRASALTDDTATLQESYSESQLPSDLTTEDESDRVVRLLLGLSRNARVPSPPSQRGEELLERLLRS